MAHVLHLRAGPTWRCVQPAAHGGADEKGAGDDAGNADVTHRLDVVLRQAQPVYESADAQEDHAVPVRPLRSPRLLQGHG